MSIRTEAWSQLRINQSDAGHHIRSAIELVVISMVSSHHYPFQCPTQLMSVHVLIPSNPPKSTSKPCSPSGNESVTYEALSAMDRKQARAICLAPKLELGFKALQRDCRACCWKSLSYVGALWKIATWSSTDIPLRSPNVQCRDAQW